MYPNLYYAVKDLFGIDWNFLHFINSFGFFVAISFLLAAYTLSLELKRKERQGLLQPEERKIIVGKPASAQSLMLNFIFGFLLGYKFVGLFLSRGPLAANPQDFIFSSEGSWTAGILLALLFAGLNWWDKNKQKLPQPEERKIRVWPHDRVGDFTIYAAIFGFIGAKIFNSLETWDDFIKNPIASLVSFSGLTFYGGLICAALAIWYYARKHNIGFWHLNDAAAPGLMLAYGFGRIGCQVAGDGDWGIINSAYYLDQAGKVVPAGSADIHLALVNNASFYLSQFGSLEKVQHLSVKAPSFLPTWMFAYSYPHNVINEGVQIAGCSGQYCSQLPLPVFPTPFYEVIVGIALFFLLWSLRKKFVVPGKLFGLYLLVNGIERFFIEKIRVNSRYDIFGFHPTQAEIISTLLVISGALLLILLKKKPYSSSLH
ncbi:MAG: prolipoprotein diacylglyceryl transferase [Bacteroidetes bacterium]|nr:prolipoprotein diacylglyceryl transferase [Bacteroidota bacterium]MBS1974123.1 prolipoprotein diacylglyceryl transferase [Bacteroidota bacterium]